MSVIDSLKDLPDISFIDNLSLEQCREQMKGWWEEKYEEINEKKYSLSDIDMEKLLLDTCAMMYYQALQYIDFTGKQNLLKYSTGAFLENKVADMRIFRNTGKKSTVKVRFQLSEALDSVYTIPKGTLCASEDDMYFSTMENAEIPIGEVYVDVLCECTEAGTDGNEYKEGTITTLVAPLAYVESICNVSTSAGGTEPDDDEVLAEKRFLAPSGLNGWGGDPYYKFHVKSCNSLIGDIVTASPKACYTDISFIMKDGSIPGDEVIYQVQEYINQKCVRELGDVVTVKSPDTEPFSIDMDYYINESDRENSVTIQKLVDEAVEKYTKWQCSKFGRDINPDKLRNFVLNAGAKRCVIRAPIFTDVEEHVIPIITETNVTYGGIEND